MDYLWAGHFAPDGDVNKQESPVLKQEQRVPATGAALPLASPHAGPEAPPVQREELCTLGDVIADLTRLKVSRCGVHGSLFHRVCKPRTRGHRTYM